MEDLETPPVRTPEQSATVPATSRDATLAASDARPLVVSILPRDVDPVAFAGRLAIVIDVLRASTVICAALAAGAIEIVPTLSVEDARALASARQRKGETVVLGGERGGVRIQGFELDNSPASYTPETVGRRTLVFTTTNGTAALLHARGAARVLVGSLVNRESICDAVAHDSRVVHILCAGTQGETSMDDCLAAGAIVDRLLQRGRKLVSDDAGLVCLRLWRSCEDRASLIAALRTSRGGRQLGQIGFGSDIERCAELDSSAVVPQFDPVRGVIHAATS